ncbi:methyl-accepting chemotaxis protein [Aquincola tertiaricarbonis]|uniref:Methyl-accepting chemotaxis protein n=1 Tax=Aquincola tertiaricarbonis TaxID=391953 RepID=A0ABY4SH60_AQUTE|nr:methyl-accepting chemotaxis protein [Aquincola tertiaricarbonis]URI11462.1 methyl-accepting chemotaxis protein [Aquincola tertiaricarbonis]
MAVKLSIGKQLGLGFALVLGLVVAMAAVSLLRLQASQTETHEMLDLPLRKERLVTDWFAVVNAGTRRTTAIARSADSSLAAFFAEDTKASTAKNNELQKALEALLAGDEEKKVFAAISGHRKDFIRLRDQIMQHKRDGQDQQALTLLEQQFQPAAAAYLNSMTQLVELQRKDLDARAAALEATNARSSLILWSLTALALLSGVGLAYAITRRIAGPLREAAQAAQRVAGGDLTTALRSERSDEAGELLRALEHMRGQLVDLVRQVRNNAEGVLTASSEIAQGNMDLSERTEQQASALQQTAATMEELSATVRRNAENAQQANHLGGEASAVAARGGTAVKQVVDTMREIQQSSQRITDIIGTIDGIAFQTNILALNAAVEAARAGEQGRGFAVVAGEVRMLAQRSAEAARQIKGLIGDSTGKVAQGSALVEQAGVTINEVVGVIGRVSTMVAEISVANGEQSQGVGQIGQAVSHLDLSTQQNAALVEQSAAAAQSLKQQAAQLVEAVSAFKLAER